MARQRSKARPTNTNTNERNVVALTPEQIAELLSNTRTKGQYDGFLGQFIDSGEAGVNAMEQWVELKGKKATTVKQGFDNAKAKNTAPEGADRVKVISQEGSVFLLNLAHESLQAEAA